jgi:hypothetical protein
MHQTATLIEIGFLNPISHKSLTELPPFSFVLRHFTNLEQRMDQAD